ncbi:MAG: hypothetical protein GTN53_30890, partial [Candidatus Aminicenantes bacterium]|nr:hypothetical protein [Candidatus Aminicenantes bacterium]NIQ72101.1 hypothetical protein [Candidatus Aminicenantes bacterium]NIT26916.1 hypothetical protein [Candidatus Aminicenantes bacterium]
MTDIAPEQKTEQVPAPSKQEAQTVELDTGECLLTGHDVVRIPAGEYEASYSHYETAAVFAKKL